MHTASDLLLEGTSVIKYMFHCCELRTGISWHDHPDPLLTSEFRYPHPENGTMHGKSGRSFYAQPTNPQKSL